MRIENKISIIQDKRGNVLRALFGIGMSKASFKVVILVNSKKINGYTIHNDAIDPHRLSGNSKNCSIIFNYSRHLQTFLSNMAIQNLLEAEKQLVIL